MVLAAILMQRPVVKDAADVLGSEARGIGSCGECMLQACWVRRACVSSAQAAQGWYRKG